MGAFFAAATGFPTVVFTAALTVVVLFWLLVALGAADAHGHAHAHLNSRAHGDGWGLGGVPVTLAFSLFTAVGWLISYCASVLLVPSGPVGALVGAVVLIGTVYVSWRATKLFVRPLHRLFPDEHGPSRLDFVGLTCTIRTGRVDAGFGQAEVRSADGSAAVVQVRQTGGDSGEGALASGSTGLLYAYDETGEFFWVAPYDSALDPRTGPGTTG
ncbi:hypothetical protein OG194_21365 [Streptomyces sp. NBC_01288]|uniref:hypothetical protein n=1 Tax=Streptomyces sp. NBC_01288 TaxID=2903814 RepID=UPI002E104C3D|nr:hypothetical protein OG194_21365 [Streptomyces sp. NBC_01288]